MTTLGIVVLCLLSLCVVVSSGSRMGFILNAPKHLDAGSTEYLAFTPHNLTQGGTVTVQLVHRRTQEVMADTLIDIKKEMSPWVELTIPHSPLEYHAQLRVKGTLGGGYKIEEEKEAFVRRTTYVTFIQTDKPIYKPGQKVQFRILPLDIRLRPLKFNTVGDIWVQDPTAVRVAQWKEMRLDQGVVQLELPLSEEPRLGTWGIAVSIKQVYHYQSFEVQKYVLPKFEVTVKPPPFVMADAGVIPVQVCAWYTYGKKVDGAFKVKVSYKRHSWEKKNQAIPSIKYSGLISGCETININTWDLLMQTPEFGYRTLNFIAKVTENGTGAEGNASALLDITHSPLQLTFLGQEDGLDYFKPGLPYYGQVLVSQPTGVPVANEKIEICGNYHDQPPTYFRSEPKARRCHLFTSNKKGLVSFSVAPMPKDIIKIAIVAEAVSHESVKYHQQLWSREKLSRPSSTLELRAWHSPSGNYLQIQPQPGEMQCNSRQSITIQYTKEKGVTLKFFNQILSRGGLVQQGSHQRFYYEVAKKKELYDLMGPDTPQPRPYSNSPDNSTEQPDIGEFLLGFDPRANMSPLARLLVFYIREDGEIVADARTFRIARCLENKVNLHFRHEQQYPGTEASMLLSASPFSLCGIGLVDKSARLLKPEEQFTKKNILRAVESYDVGKGAFPRQVSEEYCMRGDSESSPTPKMDDGYFVPFSRSISHHVDTAMAFEEAGMIVMTDLPLENRPCVATQPIAIAYDMSDNRRYRMDHTGGTSPAAESEIRQTAPRDPVLQEVTKEEENVAEEIRSYFPETWLWEMHPVGASGQTVIKHQLPHTLTQWVGGAVCVDTLTGLGLYEESNITAFQPFFVSFALPYSVVRGEVLPLVVSVFNYLSECLPIQLSLEPSDEYRILSESRWHRLCVCGGESGSHRFTLEASALGELNVTVYGFSLEDDEEVCGNEVTARLSARDAMSKQLLVEAEGFPKEEVFNYFVCPENTNGTYAAEVDLLLPEDVVEGSTRAHVSVTGDVMGPALEGLGSLVKLPVGCGEQNMVLFAPNIFVLDYLTSTGRLTDKVREECVSNMNIGYQRQMRYKHQDGSYSAFGPGDGEGSLWLTAFVVRSFGRAADFMTVDYHDLTHSASWMLEKQFENGCFEPTGRLLNKAMKGGLANGEPSLAPLTAYVLIALLESRTLHPNTPAIRSGLTCLETEPNPGSYALALYAYATTLAQEKRAAYHYLRRLEDAATVRGSHMCWESPTAEGGSKSVDIETAAYYILSRTKLDGRESVTTVLPVVRWITQQRNAHGGFVSTQDTVVALQALAQYSALQSTSHIDLGLVVESDELVKGFKVDEDNKLVTQTHPIPALPAVIDLEAVGDGCALVQFYMRYNVEKVSGSEALDLSVNAVRVGSSICNLPRLDICMRYKIPDQKTNMAVVSVKMLSGFLPDEWSLYELQSDTDVQLKRHELDGNRVNLYFNELTNDQKCFSFFIKSESEVEEIKPSSVKLYDYYQPDLEIAKEFTIPSVCSLPGVDREWTPTFPIDDETPYSILTLPPKEDILTTDSHGEADVLTTVGMLSTGDELADEASRSEGNTSHLGNFVDVHQDLDFPDGMEGNVPVSVLPSQSEDSTPNCPTCRTQFPADFNDIYCNAAFALRVIVRDGKVGTVKILQDISYFHSQPKAMKKFAKLKYDHKCPCAQLQEKSSIHFVIGTSTDLWSSEAEKHSISLSDQVYVISSPEKTVQTEVLKTARNTCNSDP